ncbi:MAG: replication restart helicase PriA [Chitinophagaceae bacterium]
MSGLFSTSSLYAEVIIPAALPQTYTWSVPDYLQEGLQPGCRVEVNLGKKKKYTGIVKRLFTELKESITVKDILQVLDPTPVLSLEQLQLWEWIADYYMCSEGEVMAAALPSYFRLSSETILQYEEEYGDDFSALDEEEYLVAEALLLKKELRLPEVQAILEQKSVYSVIQQLLFKKVCLLKETLKEGYKPRLENYIQLAPEFQQEEKLANLLNGWTKAPKQMELLLAYLHLSQIEGAVTQSALLKKSGASAAQLKGLKDKGILLAEKRAVGRLPSIPPQCNIDFVLTKAQQKAYEDIAKQFSQKKVCLLHGVTSSGKTNVYIKLIADALEAKQQVLYLLPEIALTSQLIRRLQKHFGGYVGVYHSKFSPNERIEIWNKVKEGEISIIIGPRSAIFLPFQQLGLVICDEEHDSSFKQQEPAPRYHGRDAAIFLASIFGANTLLGSATPSVETYYHAKTGKYGLVILSQRFGDLAIPPLKVIDMRAVATKDKEQTLLSPALREGIQQVLDKGSQVILFQNRRGYSPYQLCGVCKWIPHCKHCDVSLTYHKQTHRLLCHYCGSSYAPVHRCAACGSDKFMQRSFGTELIEERLQELYPSAHVARMDVDAVRGKLAHDQLVQQFEQGQIDILIGTQMVVKGLDVDKVDLVGILDADGLLQFADFRVHERAFQLMEQVSGRAGRREATGIVMVQTSQTKHPVIQQVIDHDYVSFFESELPKRKEFNYPPFSRLIQLSFRHSVHQVAVSAAKQFVTMLSSSYGKYITGPAPSVVLRVRNQYRIELLLKLPRNATLLTQCKLELADKIALLHSQKEFRSVTVVADVDVN